MTELEDFDDSIFEEMLKCIFGTGGISINNRNLFYKSVIDPQRNTIIPDILYIILPETPAENMATTFIKNYIAGKYFIENEKMYVVKSTINYNNRVNVHRDNSITIESTFFILTKYSRFFIYTNSRIVVWLEKASYIYHSNIEIHEHNTWLPLKYIKMINKMDPDKDIFNNVLCEIKKELNNIDEVKELEEFCDE